MTPRFELVSKEGCHLCEDFLQALVRLQAEAHFEMEVIDIQQNERMQAQYADKIPVLLFQGEMVCHYYLAPEKVRSVLTQYDRVR